MTAVLSIVLEPFLPFTAAKLRGMLGIGGMDWDDVFRTDLIGGGAELGQPQHLFRPITEEEIKPEVERLHANMPEEPITPSAKGDDAPSEKARPNIAFDDFAKLDLRAGRITAAEAVPKADKLLKLTVDVGEAEPRTVVSGIAQHYDPEDLPGRQVVLVCNLEPRMMRGVLSQGMVLMAEDSGGKLVFVGPEAEIAPGSEVR